MAKFQFGHGVSFTQDPAYIGILPRTNHRKDYGEQSVNDKLCHSMAQLGWLMDKPTKLMLATEAQALEAQQLRQVEWDRLKAESAKAGTPESRDLLAAWEATYVRKGELPLAIYINNCTFRRFSQLAKANHLRMAGKAAVTPENKPMVLPPILAVPAIGAIFESETDRILDQFMENYIDREGKKETTSLEKMNGLRMLFQHTQKEMDFQRALGSEKANRTMAQKCMGIFRCDFLYPEVQLVDRLNREAGTVGHIPFGPLDKEIVRVCGQGALPKEREADCTTPVQVLERHIERICGPKNPKSAPMMDRAMIVSMSKEGPNDLLKDVMSGVQSADLSKLDMMKKYAKSYNAHRKHTLDGVDPDNLAAYIAAYNPSVDYKS